MGVIRAVGGQSGGPWQRLFPPGDLWVKGRSSGLEVLGEGATGESTCFCGLLDSQRTPSSIPCC